MRLNRPLLLAAATSAAKNLFPVALAEFEPVIKCRPASYALAKGESTALNLRFPGTPLFEIDALGSDELRNLQFSVFELETLMRVPEQVQLKCSQAGVFDFRFLVLTNDSATKLKNLFWNVCRVTLNCGGAREPLLHASDVKQLMQPHEAPAADSWLGGALENLPGVPALREAASALRPPPLRAIVDKLLELPLLNDLLFSKTRNMEEMVKLSQEQQINSADEFLRHVRQSRQSP